MISQYGSSPIIAAIIQSLEESTKPDNEINQFLYSIFDIDTAQGFALDIWGRILGVSRVIVLNAASESYVGFNEGQTGANDYQSFGFGTFFVESSGGASILSDDAYRTLLYVKALANISDCTPKSYNRMLTALFGRGCYCAQDGALKGKFVFPIPLNNLQVSILTASGVIPKPAASTITIA
jgi:hypothetical protein